MRFRGREMAHRDIGAQQCLRVAERLRRSVHSIESHPRMDGRQMFMILAPLRTAVARPKTRSADDDLPEDDDSEEAGAPAEVPADKAGTGAAPSAG